MTWIKRICRGRRAGRLLHKRRSVAVRLRYLLPEIIYRPLFRWRKRLFRLWNINSGCWQWLQGKPLSIKALSQSLWRGANPSSNYFILLFLSGLISTMGLLAASTATVIGAMLVAPMMGPVTAIAFALSIGNRRLLKRAGLALIASCLIVIATAYLLGIWLDLNTLNPEIAARTQPTLLDLGVALAAGATGAFAKIRREVSDALPGVAIAVALVPPLSVVGIGLAMASQEIIVGSAVLFLTSLSGIVLSSALVFIWQSYGSFARARRALLATTLSLIPLAIPLGLSLNELLLEAETHRLVNTLIRQRTTTFGNTDIRSLQVRSTAQNIVVGLEVAAPAQSISTRQVELVHRFLENELRSSVDLNVEIVPLETFQIQSDS